jgi:hypothetical protein
MRLTGRRGQALESFWAGQVDAQHAVAQMRGITPATPKPPTCWLCDGLGQVVTAIAEEGRRRGLLVIDGEVKAETCMACLGTGRER